MIVDWLDLEEGWNTYQGNKAIVRQAIVVVCKATDMAVTYFTQSSKKDKNISLIQDFVTWVALQYNFEVKVIQCQHHVYPRAVIGPEITAYVPIPL